MLGAPGESTFSNTITRRYSFLRCARNGYFDGVHGRSGLVLKLRVKRDTVQSWLRRLWRATWRQRKRQRGKPGPQEKLTGPATKVRWTDFANDSIQGREWNRHSSDQMVRVIRVISYRTNVRFE